MEQRYFLTNVFWNNSYSSSFLFNSTLERANFFKLDSAFNTSKTINFTFHNLLINTTNISITENPTRYNYVVIQTGMEDLPYLFYFITKTDKLNAQVVKCYLELDVLTTYLPSTYEYNHILVNRAMVDRFIDTGTGYIFNLNENSEVLGQSEFDNIAQFKKDVKKPNYVVAQDVFNTYKNIPNEIVNFVNNNIVGFTFYYMDASQKYDLYSCFANEKKTASNKVYFYKNNFFRGSYKVYCAPIYKSDSKRIVVKTSTSENFTWQQPVAMNDNIFYENYRANIYSIQTLPYFVIYNILANLTYNTTYHIADNGNLVINGVEDYGSIELGNNSTTSTPNYLYSFGKVNNGTSGHNVMCNIVLSKNIRYNFDLGFEKLYKNDLQLKNYKHEPKCYESNIQSFDLRVNGTSQAKLSYLYSIDTTDEIDYYSLFEFNEALSPLSTKATLKVISGAYNESSIMGGCVFNEDMSVIFPNDQLQDFLANNKNFFLQKTLQYVSGGLVGLTLKAPKKIVSNALSTTSDIINTSLTLDNYANAPKELNGAVSSAELNYLNEIDLAPSIVIYSALEKDLKSVNDYYYEYGYQINKIKTKQELNYYLNSRRYFNYIQARIELTNAYTSDIKHRIEEVFRNGIKLYHVMPNAIDETKDNLETSIGE